MNSIHKVIEAAENGSLSFAEGIRESVQAELASFLSKNTKGAICFDAGSAKDVCAQFSLIREICILPFPICWIEFKATIRATGQMVQSAILAQQLHGNEIEWVTLFNLPGTGWVVMDCGFDSPWNCEEGDTHHINLDERNALISDTTRGWAQLFVCAINCTNIEAVEERAPERLNAARRRRGKQPLFSTYTLQIKSKKSGADSDGCVGGDAIQRRVHLVRGHIRKHHWQPGKFIWVNAHARGSAQAGMIHKGYELVMA